jgi:sugar/nucleoside kinase (ribokinase family)
VSDFDYVAVGHVTVDVIEDDGERRPGGGAFYSALQAARLGLRTMILTKGRPRELEELLEPYREELALRILPAEHTTTLATSGTGAERRQRVLAWAGPMAEPIEVDTAILHLAAVARETPSCWRGHASFVGLTPQGLVRKWKDSAEGYISLVPLDPKDLPGQIDAVVLSNRERPFYERLLTTRAPHENIAHAREKEEKKKKEKEESDDEAGHGGASAIVAGGLVPSVLAITAGSAPTVVVLPDGATAQVAALPVVQPRDDLGAGDVFAAAFFIALHDGLSPAEAAAYGNAAAAVRIAGTGPQAIGDKAAIARAQHR